LLAAVSGVHAPAVPYFSWNACPFECCRYGNWTALRDVTVRARRSTTAPAAFVVRKGERVRAVTGVVVTRRLGVVRALKPLSLGEGRHHVQVRAGQSFYILHYWGEGYFAFWFDGATYSDARYITPTSTEPHALPGAGVELVVTPKWEWWVRLRTSRGRTGWVSGNRGFDGSDSCAG
jgi:hypothetical protein